MLSYLRIIVCLVSFAFSTVFSDDSAQDEFYKTHFFVDDRNANGRNALKSSEYKWPNGIVPYLFDDDYIERDKSAVLSAMEIFQKQTCIRFVLKRSNHTEHIKFKKSNNGGCGALVGFRAQKNESNDVVLSENCLKMPGAIQHELLHVLALLHEQSRADRDDYVDIIWENIIPGRISPYFIVFYSQFLMRKLVHHLNFKGHEHNFAKSPPDFTETFGLPYDFDSLMHYPRGAFAKPGTNATIVSKVSYKIVIFVLK